MIGFDPDYGTPPGYFGHGVPYEFSERTGIHFVRNGVQQLEWDDNSFYIVFCISVLEHMRSRHDPAEGMREIARVLKPGGSAIILVDANLKKRVVSPLELIWESGLEVGSMDLATPRGRLGIFNDGMQPADIFGFVLRKTDAKINTEYGKGGPLTEAWRVAYFRDTYPPEWPDVPETQSLPPDISIRGMARTSLVRLLRKFQR